MTARSSALASGGLLAMLGGLYATQGLLSGLVHEGLPVLLRARGIGLDKIGLLSLLFLPSAIKFLWAPRMDRLCADGPAQRLRWAGRFQLTLLGGVLALFLLPLETALLAVIGLLLALMLVSVTQDIVTDGMAVQTLPAPQRGLGNSMQIGGSYLGYILGGGALVALVGRSGWREGVLYLALLVGLCGLPLLWMRQRAASRPAQAASASGSFDAPATPATCTAPVAPITPAMPATPPRPATQATPTTPITPATSGPTVISGRAAPPPSLRAAWRRPALRWGMATIVLTQAPLRWFSAIMLTFLVDRGFGVVEVGLLSGGGVALAGVGGALLAGLLLKRVARRAMLTVSLASHLLLQLGYLLIEGQGWHARPVLAGVFLLFCTAMSFGFVVLYTIMTDLASPAQAGTDFSLLQCTDAWCALVFGLAAGAVTAHFGYGTSFVITSALALAGLLLAPRLYLRAAPEAQAMPASTPEQFARTMP